ncbi:MAG TPA: phosphopantetheine-binding protein, partial [Herpetosiphonaceae bacterium]
GELYIGGVQLARGYLNRPDLTATQFIPDLFSDRSGARLYRTGDLARYRPDGNIEFLGRADTQVKIRGFRVEPGEIEAVLSQHPAVREAAVVLRDDRLVAYVVGENGEPRTKNQEPNEQTNKRTNEQTNKEQSSTASSPSPTAQEREGEPVTAGKGDAGGEGLRAFLQSRLPEHMIPTAFVPLDALPLTTNGKLDRRALPLPAQAEATAAFVPPRTPAEELIAGIWAEVLGLERVGVQDNFFEIGGHSLLAVQIVSRMRRAFRADLTLRAVFQAPTIAGLAALLDQSQTALDELDELDDDEDIPRLDRSGRSLDQLVAELENLPPEAIRARLQQQLRPDDPATEAPSVDPVR